jgi:hypothetical protein
MKAALQSSPLLRCAKAGEGPAAAALASNAKATTFEIRDLEITRTRVIPRSSIADNVPS